MNDEEKINQLAQTLYSKGFAGSLWDAKNKARDILGLNGRLKSYRSSESDRRVDGIMKDAGINVAAVKKAEEQKIQQIIQTVQEHFQNEGKQEDAKPIENVTTESKPAVEVTSLNSQKEKEQPPTVSSIPGAYFADSVEGATPEMTVNEIMGVKEEPKEENELSSEEIKDDSQTGEAEVIEETELNEKEMDADVVLTEANKEVEKENVAENQTEKKEAEGEIVKLETYDESPKETVTGNTEFKIDAPTSEDDPSSQKDYVVVEEQEEKSEEEMPKIIDEEFKEEKKEEKIIIEDNVFSEVDKDSIEEIETDKRKTE